MSRGSRRVRWPLFAAVALVAASGCVSDGIFGARGSWKPGTTAHDIVVGPLTRSFLLHVPLHRLVQPSGLTSPFPLVIVLHGSSATSEDIRQASQMDSLSESSHFIVAYPQGVGGAGGLYPTDWNAGVCCGAASRENIDDLGFLAALVRRTEARLPIDRHRIYIAGFSDGGRMAYHAACKLAPMIAAIAVVSGSLQDDTCVPSVAVPVIAIHGTSDSDVPYYDPALTSPPGPVPTIAAPLPSSAQFWTAANRCSTGSVDQLSTNVVRTSVNSCLGAEVVFYTIEGGIHAWPSAPDGIGSQPPMSELAASSVIVQFFARQVRS